MKTQTINHNGRELLCVEVPKDGITPRIFYDLGKPYLAIFTEKSSNRIYFEKDYTILGFADDEEVVNGIVENGETGTFHGLKTVYRDYLITEDTEEKGYWFFSPAESLSSLLKANGIFDWQRVLILEVKK